MPYAIHFISLGCAKNVVNCEQMMALCCEAGHTLLDTPEGADVAVVNTCGFLSSASEEAIGHILALGERKARGELKKILVTGCMTQRYGEDVPTELPEVDGILGTGSYKDIVSAVEDVMAGGHPRYFGDINAPVDETGRVLTTPPWYAYLRIAEGCDNHCAYCVIPSLRGRYRRRPMGELLDEAGFTDCKIVASNALDEYIIRDLVRQGARIDSFGVGERLITSRSEPVFGGVYKLAAIEADDGTIIPKIKISENAAKITTPHFKKIYRIFSRDTGKAEADLICLHDEVFDFTQPLELFDPDATWKRKVYTGIEARELMVPIFQGGELVYQVPDLQTSRAYCQRQVDALWDEVKRFENPHNYYVDLSQKLWDIKQSLLNSHEMK